MHPVLKSHLLAALATLLEEELNRAVAASDSARSSSTHEDASGKSKYETQSTELSYLADGQAMRARNIADTLRIIRDFRPPTQPGPIITMGSIVELGDETLDQKSPNEYESKRFFIVPVASGRELIHEGCKYVTLTPNTPKGKEIVGLAVGDSLLDTTKYIRKVY